MIADWVLWACARQVLDQHGARAPEHIEQRVTELARAGDERGVRTRVAIADRVDRRYAMRGIAEVCQRSRLSTTAKRSWLRVRQAGAGAVTASSSV